MVKQWVFGLSLLVLAAGSAAAQAPAPRAGETQPDPAPAQSESSDQPGQQAAQPSIAASLGPLGDPGGARSFLGTKGITFSLTYLGEVLGNATGGQKRGATYQGRLDLQVDADLDRLLGWQGATFHTNVYQIHGRGLTRYYLGNLLTTSGIEALPTTRLYELWIEQKLFGDHVAVRAGQLGADTEFLVSQYAALFVNATYGWPAIAAANLPSGGPAYPQTTPGIRVKLQPSDEIAVLLAVFNGDPAGPGGLKDPQLRDHSGFELRTSDPPLFIGELQYAYNQGKDSPGLPGTLKIGGWHHFGRFDSRRFGGDGLLIADPTGSGIARRLRGNDGLYAVFDQLIYRPPGTSDAGIGVFVRASGSPDDRNLISVYLDGGLTFKGLIEGRPDDTFGVSGAYAQIARGVRGFDRDVNVFSPDVVTPVRSSEALVEVTYQATIVPGWTVQPDFQYVFRPGAGAANPRDPDGRPTKDAAIFGLRTSIRY